MTGLQLRRLARLAPVAVIALALALFLTFRLDRTINLDRLVEGRMALRALVAAQPTAALGLFATIYVLITALSIPAATIMTLTGGFLFGAVAGTLVSAVCATTGATLVFLAARGIFEEFVLRRAGPAVARIRAGVREGAVSYMFFLRLSPLFPFWLVNMATACAGVPLRTFVWTTLVGILPLTFVFAWTGQNFEDIAAASQAALDACRATGRSDCRAALPVGSILSPEIVATLFALSLAALLPVAVKAWRSRRRMDKDWARKTANGTGSGSAVGTAETTRADG